MILDKSDALAGEPGATLDDLFRRAGVRNPDGVALTDPPNRARFTDGAPRKLTYAEADRAISAFATRLRDIGLATDAVVAIQFPNTVDGVVALMGVLRAGMIVAPLPLLWRTHEMAAALRAAGAKAIVTSARAGTVAPVQAAMRAAAEVFAIRNVCCFGCDLPDGVVPLDDLFGQAVADRVHEATRQGTGGSHVAAITFDVGADGISAVPRSHSQIIGGGLASFLEVGFAQDGVLLSTIPPVSFAGLALAVVPWLLAGGTLALHQDCDPSALAAQCAGMNAATVILPGPAAAPLEEAGILGHSITHVIALWRAPERMTNAAAWRGRARLVDVAAFGEIGLLAAPRGPDDVPAAIPHGIVAAPRDAAGGIKVAETARSSIGTLLLRGPMVPSEAYPPVAQRGDQTASDASSFVDTGFPCRHDDNALSLSGPPAGIAVIGGYRFPRRPLELLVAAIDADATIMTVPDGLLGERLAGATADRSVMRAALQARGFNPLVSEAFWPRCHAVAA